MEREREDEIKLPPPLISNTWFYTELGLNAEHSYRNALFNKLTGTERPHMAKLRPTRWIGVRQTTLTGKHREPQRGNN